MRSQKDAHHRYNIQIDATDQLFIFSNFHSGPSTAVYIYPNYILYSSIY